MERASKKKALAEQYPSSEPCSCPTCLAYRVRPGWRTVDQAATLLGDELQRHRPEPVHADSGFGALGSLAHCAGSERYVCPNPVSTPSAASRLV
jgi:hypothetical protein